MARLIPLEPTDYIFLIGENRQQPMHVGCLIFYRAGEGQNADELAAEHVAKMLDYGDAVPPFNYRLTRRWGLSFWEQDPEFDIGNHVRHVQLPHPGDIKELLKLVGVFHGLTMDRSLPLWYVWVISGLPDNRFAVYAQMHHALLDGVSGARMIVRSHTRDPEQRDMPPFWAVSPTAKPRKTAPEQDDMETDLFSIGVALLRSNRNVARAVTQAWQRDRIGLFESELFHAPDTMLNVRITGARRFVADSFSLSRMKAVGREFDATLNDVLMIMISRSLQRYLRDEGALPDEALRALMPVNLRDDDSVGGNQIAMVRASMGTQHDDLELLIDEVLSSIRDQKTMLSRLGKQEKQLYAGIMLGPWLANIATGMMGRFKTANTLVSNVPGPRETLYWNGLELDAMYPVSIPVHQSAINFTVFSYRDRVEIGIIGCRNRVPHLQRLLEYMHEALNELENIT